MRNILNSKHAVVLTLALLTEGVIYYTARANDYSPTNQPLSLFATEIGPWHMTEEGHIDKETMDMLHADDTVTRTYNNAAYPVPVGFYVAYFKTQRTGQSPHSPRNCLPGSGWEPLKESVVDVPLSTDPGSITVNRYLVARGENASVVFYWYQTRKRVIASDYSAKIWLVLDSIRYHRSDTALVRVMVPVVNGNDAKSTEIGVDFVKNMFPLLQSYLPS